MAPPKMQNKSVPVDNIPDTNLPPWPEWRDDFINKVQWTGNKPPKSPGSSSQLSRLHNNTEVVEEFYEDPAGLVELPADIPVKSWVRPHQLLPDIKFVVETDPTPLDLLENNNHLIDFKIMRMIMASVICLEREAFYRPFPIEFQSEKFVFNGGWQWKPWLHVYSLTTAGKGQIHKLQYNRYGKYIVRLYFMGKWRRIYVDDLLPVDAEGQLLLPSSRPDNLWLPILTKALLRVAALSWQRECHNVDFTAIHCLTGWIPTSILCKGCNEYQLWCICCKLMPSSTEVVKSPGGCVSDLDFSCAFDDATANLDSTQSVVIFGYIIDQMLHGLGRRTGQWTSLDRLVLFSNVRYNNELPNPLWKKYRWEEWAYNNGIISEIEDKSVRNVQVFNPLGVKLPSSMLQIQFKHSSAQECWINFDLLIKILRTLEVYFKPSYMKYSLHAWTVDEMVMPPVALGDVLPRTMAGKPPNSPKSKTKQSPTKSNVDTSTKKGNTKKIDKKGNKDVKKPFVEWPVNLTKPSFFYLTIDSMFCKQLYICLSACDTHKKPTYAHVVFGQFEWHRPTVAPIIFMMSTSATKAYNLPLSPGRHVFRVWHQLPENFCLQIFSNTEFSSGSKMYIQNALTLETVSYQHYGSEISQKMESLLDARQGGEEHGRAYNKLMDSLMPPKLNTQLPWPDWFNAYTQLQQAFEESLVEMLVETVHSTQDIYLIMQAYQILFLNPVFGEDVLSNINSEYYYYIKDRHASLLKKMREKDLQTETLSTKPSKKKDKEKSKKKENKSPAKSPKSEKSSKKKEAKEKSSGKGDSLRKLLPCKEKSLILIDSNNAIAVLKKMMAKVPHLKQFYPFYREDGITIVYQDYLGELNAKEKWTVLIRCVFNIHSTQEVPCSLHIWAPLEKLIYRLIDNDTLQDIPLGFRENSVAYLSKNKEGYTCCVYGLIRENSVNWRLRSIGVREGDTLHICHGSDCQTFGLQPPPQSQQTLTGYYLPNKEQIIARCFLDVFEDVTILLRLHLSSFSVFCSLAIFDEYGNNIQSTTGTGHIIIPILKLKGTSSNENISLSELATPARHRYYVEVKLFNNSWPLTLQQIKAMHYYKEHLFDTSFPNDQIDEEINGSQRISYPQNLKSDEQNTFEKTKKPVWIITVVSDLNQRSIWRIGQKKIFST